MATLELRTFGGLDVSLEGARVASFEARSAEALVVYLAHTDAPVHRDVLAHLLWPERPHDVARANLRTAVHRVRRALPEHLVAQRSTLALHAVWSDARALETALRVQDRATAVALYRGEFLEGFTLDTSPGLESWVATEAERYRDLVAGALQELVSAALAEDDVEAGLRHARHLLRIDPLHEPVHRALARALARSGRRSAALAHLGACARAMAEGFGLEPDPATGRLVDAIREGSWEARTSDPATDAPSATIRTATASARPARVGSDPRPLHGDVSDHVLDHDLPRFAGPFVGREAELELVARRLADAECRWLTILGPGGVGKTRLAVEAARSMAEAFADGVCFLGLAGVRDVEHVSPALASALGLDPLPPGDPATHVARYLHDKQMLLVVDNVEHLTDAGPRLAAMLRSAAHTRVLATSRARLHLAAEWLLVIDGMRDGASAEELFTHHAARSGVVSGPGHSTKAVREICELVENMPLALELAATWVHALSLERIAESLRARSTLLAAPRPDAPERHRSLGAAFDASWDLLSEPLQAVFARLGVFRGGFMLEEAARVAQASEAELLALVDRSLVRARGGGRFDMHELLRQYALARLGERSEIVETSRRHLHAYLAVAHEAGPAIYGTGLEHGLERLRIETDNVRAALAWGFEQPSDVAAAVDLVVSMGPYWRLTCAIEEARGWAARADARLDAVPERAAAVRYARGHFAWMAGDLDEADTVLSAIVDAWDRTTPDGRAGRAMTLVSHGMTAVRQRRLDVAETRFTDALAEVGEAGPAWWRAIALGWLGNVAGATGAYDTARRRFDACLADMARLDNPWGTGMFVASAAQLHLAEGDVDGARRLGVAAASLLERVGFKHALAPVYALLATVAEREGLEDEASRRAEQAIAVYRDLGAIEAADDVAVRYLERG